MKERVLITGGSGLVGRQLTELLIRNGYEVAILSRKKNNGELKSFFWDFQNNILDPEAIEFADVIIHLAGEGIADKRWTNQQKNKIEESRTMTTKLLFKTVKNAKKKPHTIISASAIGIYGISVSDKVFTEDDISVNDFVSQLVVKWEKAVDEFQTIGIRTVKFRIGIVLSKEGGALAKMMIPIKLGIGSAIGNGTQFMPWIAIDDLTRMFLFATQNKIEGVFNAVSPQHITNNEFSKVIANHLNKPFFMPKVPAFLLKILLGEMSQIVLRGNKVSSKKICELGFEFNFKNINDFLKSEF